MVSLYTFDTINQECQAGLFRYTQRSSAHELWLNRPKRDPLELGKNEPTFYAMMIGFQPYCSLSYRLHFCVKASKRQSVK
ncbi:permease component [Pseudomonas syringae pv. actinidiae]|uniref:Permease component n=1 Tax=Pseudomonas syringae pv. actinidiae TaxID=103796 RepID=A0AAN4Q0S4_PSESF|nr:permease component [Pseudomonas syringae pv. actinidiae]